VVINIKPGKIFKRGENVARPGDEVLKHYFVNVGGDYEEFDA